MKAPQKINRIEDLIKIVRWLESDISIGNETDDKFTWGISQEIFPFGLWFRGEGDYSAPLAPGMFRINYKKGEHYQEPSIMNHLKIRIPEIYDIKESFGKLCIAQHYNIPTRLLDWSESIFVAAYFASISDNGDSSKDAYLYVMNAKSLNYLSGLDQGRGLIHTPEDFGIKIRSEIAFSNSKRTWIQRVTNKYPNFDWALIRDDRFNFSKDQWLSGVQMSFFNEPVAVMPLRAKTRMMVQGSTFTLHGGSYSMEAGDKPNKNFPKRITGYKRHIYRRFKIPGKFKSQIKKDLFNIGIHQGVLFPELDRQREYLETIW